MTAPVAWLTIDPVGRRAVYLDQARAQQQASLQHGQLVPLVPLRAAQQPPAGSAGQPPTAGDPA